MIKEFYILGNHIQALGISRIVYNLGKKVALFSEDKLSLTRFSNTCERFYFFNEDNCLLEQLLTLKNQNKETVLIPTNDKMVYFLCKNYEQLNKKYILGISKPGVIDICYNKINTYKKAAEIGLDIPQSIFPENIDELNHLPGNIEYPVIIKPAVMHTFHKIFKKKAFLCNNKTELLENYKLISNHFPLNEIIIQEYIKGGPKNLFSFGGFAADGKVYGGFVVNRVRQNPMDFGNSTCFAVSIKNEEIQNKAIKFLESINYFGLAEVEFMFDDKDLKYKLLEINPRPWKWHSISNILNVNLFEMLVSYFERKSFNIKFNDIYNAGWIESVTDTYISIKEIIKGRMNLNSYIYSIKIKKERAVYSVKDPLPGLMYLILLPYYYFKRN